MRPSHTPADRRLPGIWKPPRPAPHQISGAVRAQEPPRFRFGFRPDAPSAFQPLNQPTIASGQDADAMRRKPGFLGKVDQCKVKFVAHAGHNTRYRVQVNTRYNVRA